MHPSGIVALDLDGDGDLDLVVPGVMSSEISVFANDGGIFRALPRLAVAGGPLAVTAGDFDEDGHPDVAVTLPGTERVAILLGPDLRAGTTLEIASPYDVRAADLDGDGHLDLAVTRFKPGALIVARGDGRGGFALDPALEAPDGTSSVAIADLDADGRLDLAVAGANVDRLAWYRGDGRGGFTPAGGAATHSWPSSVIAVDLGGGPPLSLVAAANLGNFLDVARAGASRMVTTGAGPAAAAAADLDGDGAPEIVVTDKFANAVEIFRRDLTLALRLDAGDGPTPVVIADLDGDGRPDLAVADAFGNDLVVYLQQ